MKIYKYKEIKTISGSTRIEVDPDDTDRYMGVWTMLPRDVVDTWMRDEDIETPMVSAIMLWSAMREAGYSENDPQMQKVASEVGKAYGRAIAGDRISEAEFKAYAQETHRPLEGPDSVWNFIAENFADKVELPQLSKSLQDRLDPIDKRTVEDRFNMFFGITPAEARQSSTLINLVGNLTGNDGTTIADLFNKAVMGYVPTDKTTLATAFSNIVSNNAKDTSTIAEIINKNFGIEPEKRLTIRQYTQKILNNDTASNTDKIEALEMLRDTTRSASHRTMIDEFIQEVKKDTD